MATFLNYDDQGFIVGTRRLESGIKSIGEDTQEIIQILKSQNQINQTVLNRIAKSNERIANKKSMRIQGVVPTYDPTSPGRNNASQPSMQSQAQSKQQHRQKLSSTSQPAQKEARASGSKDGGALSNVTSNAKVKSGSMLANRANNQSDSGSSGANRSSAGRSGAQSPEAANNAAGSVPGATRKANNPTGKNGREKKQKDSDRDELGRFTAKEKTLFDSLSKIAKSGRTGYGSYGGAQNIDPLIASANEVQDIASPIFNMATKAGKMGGAAGKAALRAGRFSFSKYKSLKRKEPLPKDQARHNKQNEETLGEILKRMPGGEGSLLGKMGRGLGLLGGSKGKGKGKGKDKDRKGNKNKGKGIKSILAGGAGAAILGAGKIGGEGVKKAAKVVGSAKVLGPLATAVGLGNLIGQWKERDHKEKSEDIGSLAGGSVGAVAGGALGTALIPIPVVGTAIGAAVGGWLGSEGGEVLGRTASPHIQSWTNDIKRYNLPQKMEGIWRTGLTPVLSKLGSLADRMGSWADQKISSASDALGDVQSIAGAIADAAGLGGLGSVAAKYESSGRGVGTISTGAGDHGGVSYGVHQLASNNGSMNAYLKSEEGKPFAQYFAGTKPGTKAFNDKYKQVVSSHGEAFKKSQHAYITRTHYMPAKAAAEKYGFDTTNRGIQEAIYSHATQYGANHTSRFKRIANSGVNMKDNEAVLKALYADKYSRVDSDFKSSSKTVRDGVRRRIQREQADVLALSKVSTVKKETKDKIDKTKEKVTDTVDRAKEAVKEVASTATEATSSPKDGSKSILPENHPLKQLGKTAKEPPNFTENIRGILNGSESANAKGRAPAQNRFMPASQSIGLDLGAPILKSVFNIPDMPSFKLPLAGGGLDKPIIVQSNNDNIGQNVSDRGLAHAITGGLGESRYWS